MTTISVSVIDWSDSQTAMKAVTSGMGGKGVSSRVTVNWCGMSQNWCSMSQNWFSMGNDWSWNVGTVSANVQIDSCGILLNIGTWFVGRNGCSVSKSIGNIVNNTHTTIMITKTIRAGDVTWTSLFFTEGTTGGVIFIITESIVAITLFDYKQRETKSKGKVQRSKLKMNTIILTSS